jgi:hypothetical protein
VVSLALNVTDAEFNEVFADQKVTVTYSVATQTIDPIYGQATSTTYVTSTKQWIFFKHSSDIVLKAFGIVDIGDAYAIMPITDSINYGDRITYDGETFEFTPDCKSVYRYANNTPLYRFFTMKKVG